MANENIAAWAFRSLSIRGWRRGSRVERRRQDYLDQLVEGGPGSHRRIAENMVNTSYTNTEVLEV